MMANNFINIRKENVLIMYFEANSFMNLYNDKKEQLRSTLGKESNEISQPCCIVLLSFACELYLKTLFCIEKIEENNNVSDISMEKGHELNNLFVRLSNNLKQIISERLNYTVEQLENELENHKNDFVKWRYIFEIKSDEFQCNISFLERIAHILCEISKSKVDKIEFRANNISFTING